MSENQDTRDRETNEENQFEKVCFMCHRTESKAGKMIDLPGGITVCPDCMQKSFDLMNSPEMQSWMKKQNRW